MRFLTQFAITFQFLSLTSVCRAATLQSGLDDSTALDSSSSVADSSVNDTVSLADFTQPTPDDQPTGTNLTDWKNIYCRAAGPGHKPTNVTGCRSALNLIRDTFPDFNRRQAFLIKPPFSTPRLPRISGPPFKIYTRESSCVIRVLTLPPGVDGLPGYFSWRDVRQTATEVTEFCYSGPRQPGLGGMESIGEPKHLTREPGWIVLIEGKEPGTVPDEPPGTDENGLGIAVTR